MKVERKKRVWVFVVLLACAQTVSLLTGARTVSLCGAGACFATAISEAGAK